MEQMSSAVMVSSDGNFVSEWDISVVASGLSGPAAQALQAPGRPGATEN
jgi:hypothetical protein